MASENITRRSDILNTQVITRDNGKRLGVISQVWVDIDRREVVAFSLRDNLIAFAGVPRYMYLQNVRQIGDVILVDNEDAIEDIEVEAYNSLVNCEVITETGELLGKVRGFNFHRETGQVVSLIIGSLGLPQIPDQLLSTYELPIEEVVSSGPNRIIVFEGAEDRLSQLTVGLLERLGIGKAPWEREEEEAYFNPTTVKTENQLGTGIPVQAQRTQPARTSQPAVQEAAWDEDDYEYETVQPQPLPQRQRQYEAMPYEDEEDNWSEATGRDRYEQPRYAKAEQPYEDEYEQPKYTKAEPYEPKKYTEQYDEDLDGDAWEDQPKPINIPKKTKQPEYEEEGGY